MIIDVIEEQMVGDNIVQEDIDDNLVVSNDNVVVDNLVDSNQEVVVQQDLNVEDYIIDGNVIYTLENVLGDVVVQEDIEVQEHIEEDIVVHNETVDDTVDIVIDESVVYETVDGMYTLDDIVDTNTIVVDIVVHDIVKCRLWIATFTDSFYRGLSAEESKRLHEYNFDHPDAFDTEKMLECICTVALTKNEVLLYCSQNA
ncbi:uridine kinase/uracil phosphoribosyltransferase 1 [Artemisia annua]|uniref:Uridine kinase/uracil phosphoribosyltransferase 1 n=1 Tax=Artemisia annua TaxID=35608 RepID=A0A2U1P4H8_ARTAN|nr:uridine kinase/uracil phosphoribosyltransferase 1 [Artemisia annua]